MQKDRLITYGIWYYGKYFPSVNRLRKRLIEKAETPEDLQGAWKELEPYLVEEKVIQDTVSNAIHAGKPIQWIKNKLKRKDFDPILSEKILAERQDELNDFTKYYRRIQDAVVGYFERGKSGMTIYQSLGSRYPQFREQIRDTISTYEDQYNKINASKLYIFLVEKWVPESKIQSRMAYRGFSYGDYVNAKKISQQD